MKLWLSNIYFRFISKHVTFTFSWLSFGTDQSESRMSNDTPDFRFPLNSSCFAAIKTLWMDGKSLKKEKNWGHHFTKLSSVPVQQHPIEMCWNKRFNRDVDGLVLELFCEKMPSFLKSDEFVNFIFMLMHQDSWKSHSR